MSDDNSFTAQQLTEAAIPEGAPNTGVEVVEPGANAGLETSRRDEMKAAVHAWLCVHSGLFSQWGLDHDYIDEAANTASNRMHEERHVFAKNPNRR